mmetsp:Transcript_41571/g.120466  ORF Transcript_41571/g.120466 Transcript_41571/m.120466 type:complete len:224 (-) Transcript_41571:253-924(-)
MEERRRGACRHCRLALRVTTSPPRQHRFPMDFGQALDRCQRQRADTSATQRVAFECDLDRRPRHAEPPTFIGPAAARWSRLGLCWTVVLLRVLVVLHRRLDLWRGLGRGPDYLLRLLVAILGRGRHYVVGRAAGGAHGPDFGHARGRLHFVPDLSRMGVVRRGSFDIGPRRNSSTILPWRFFLPLGLRGRRPDAQFRWQPPESRSGVAPAAGAGSFGRDDRQI